jgi:hypothetical protein
MVSISENNPFSRVRRLNEVMHFAEYAGCANKSINQ